MATTSKVKYGSIVYLMHVKTGRFLKSLPIPCCHPGTSGQQMVVASTDMTEETRWLVKGEDKLAVSYSAGEDVAHGHRIRLEHCATRCNLHSHGDRLSPVSKQQEVTCYGTNGKGDVRDDWFVNIGQEGAWHFNQEIRLVHADTKRPLHSHNNQSDPIFTNGEQEVTCFPDPKWNDDDLWVVVSRSHLFEKAGKHPSSEIPTRNVPSISEPWKWSCYHIEKDWHIVKTAKLAFVLIGLIGAVLGGSSAWWFQSQRIADRDETISNIKQTKDATIEAKQAVIDQKQNLLDNALKENERLVKQLAGVKLSAGEAVQSEMTVTFQIQNPSANKLEINPICDADLVESFGGRTSWTGTNPYRLAPANPKSPDSQYVIPPNDSREFTITVPDADQNKVLFVRGATVLSYTVWLLDGSRSVKGEIPFNRDALQTKKAIVKF
jgi:hypothetical protein